MYKINRLTIYTILLVALFMHLTVLNHLKILNSKPDLLLLSVVFFGLFFGKGVGLESGLVAGFLEDLFTFDIFWINTFILGMVGLLAGFLNTKFFKESKATQALLVFTCTAFSMLSHFVIVSFFMKSLKLTFPEYIIGSVTPTAFYTALASIPIFSMLINIYGIKEESEELL